MKSLIDIIYDCCEDAFDSMKSLKINGSYEFICSKFRVFVFNSLAEALYNDHDHTYTQVYDAFILVYYDEFQKKLMDCFFID